MNYTKFNLISKAELQELFDTSNTKSEILKKMNQNCYSGGNYRTLKRYTELHNIDLTIFNKNHKKFMSLKCKKLSKNNVTRTIEDLRPNNYVSSTSLRRIVLSNDLIKYICDACGQIDIHNGLPLTLQLDHIDGDNTNNTISNLRFLCPNCHTQTNTYGRKKEKIKSKSKIKKEQEISDMIDIVQNADIDYTKFGWVTKLAELLGKHPQKINEWMKLHMPDFYREQCFKRNVGAPSEI